MQSCDTCQLTRRSKLILNFSICAQLIYCAQYYQVYLLFTFTVRSLDWLVPVQLKREPTRLWYLSLKGNQMVLRVNTFEIINLIGSAALIHAVPRVCKQHFKSM